MAAGSSGASEPSSSTGSRAGSARPDDVASGRWGDGAPVGSRHQPGPHERSLRLPPSVEAPGLARRMLREVCATRPALYDDAALLVTELVSNAVRHAGTDVVVRAYLATDVLRLEVIDGSRRPVRARVAAHSEEGGRGLVLVDALADRWGVDARSDGKQVWVELETQTR